MLDGRSTESDILRSAHLLQFTKDGENFLESILTGDRNGCTTALLKYNNLECSEYAQLLQQPKPAKVMTPASWDVEGVTSQTNELHLL
jgi:hypothetical protein